MFLSSIAPLYSLSSARIGCLVISMGLFNWKSSLSLAKSYCLWRFQQNIIIFSIKNKCTICINSSYPPCFVCLVEEMHSWVAGGWILRGLMKRRLLIVVVIFPWLYLLQLYGSSVIVLATELIALSQGVSRWGVFFPSILGRIIAWL